MKFQCRRVWAHRCWVCICTQVSRNRYRLRPMETHSIKSIVLMMKPRVGLTVVISSFMIRLTIVVLPALSRPLRSLVCRSEKLVRIHTALIFAFLYPLTGLFGVWTTYLRIFVLPGGISRGWKRKMVVRLKMVIEVVFIDQHYIASQQFNTFLVCLCLRAFFLFLANFL